MASNLKRKGSGSQSQGTTAKRARWEDELAVAPSDCSPTAAGASAALISGVQSAQIYGGSFTVVGSSTTYVHNHGPQDASANILKILKSLSLPNFRHIQLDTLAKATDGTCIWLTDGDMFLFWVSNGGILWGIGIRMSSLRDTLIALLTDCSSWSWEDGPIVSGIDWALLLGLTLFIDPSLSAIS
jgi:hypothetical protein